MLRGTTLANPDNLLSQLVSLTNLPRLPEDLNAFYIPAFATPPSPSSLSSSKKAKTKTTLNGNTKSKKAKAELDSMPAWMQTFDSSSSEDESASSGSKRPRDRTSALSTHASIHSVPSHVSQYTDLWLAVLSGASVHLDDVWTRKILVGLHGSSGILGHMNPAKRVRITDWLGGLVDRGGALGMLAMNGLFVLMTTYNLYVHYFLILSLAREQRDLLANLDLQYYTWIKENGPARGDTGKHYTIFAIKKADHKRLPQLLPAPLHPPHPLTLALQIPRPLLPSPRHLSPLHSPLLGARRELYQASLASGTHRTARGHHYRRAVRVQSVQAAQGVHGHAPAVGCGC